MAYMTKPGEGSLFRNKDKDPSSGQPDHKGQFVCPCCEAAVWLSAWINETKDGQKYFGIKSKPKDDQPRREQPKQQPRSRDMDDEIPF